MSHAEGQVRFDDGLVLWVEYNGTGSYFQSRLYPTSVEMRRHWRSLNDAECVCRRDESVILATNYGNGFSLPGRACRHCLAVTLDPRTDPEDDGSQEREGLPSWWKSGPGDQTFMPK